VQIFLSLLIKILPLYVLIALGFIAGKKLNAKKETLASILIYIVTPIVIFNSIVTAKLTSSLLLLPFIFFICCSFMCILFYRIGKIIFKDNTANILALIAGTANTGYFGIPVAVELFGENIIGLMVLCILGFTVFENSLGFFIVAKGSHTVKEAFSRLLKLPTIYAFLAGLLFNLLNINLGEVYLSFAKNFIGAYTVLGMMLIGLGLSDMKSFKVDSKFLLLTFGAKFVIWPLFITMLIFVDVNFLNIFNNSVYKVMVLLSIVPLAANAVAFATELKTHPEKASVAVFLSTLFALIYIPLLSTMFFNNEVFFK
jgi:predicted permease